MSLKIANNDYGLDLSGVFITSRDRMVTRDPSKLPLLDGKRVAVVVNLAGGIRVFRGVGVYDRDHVLGNVLWVELDQPPQADGDPVIVFHETLWTGEVVRDEEYGCDYVLSIDAGAHNDSRS